jgi:hypothetical protein
VGSLRIGDFRGSRDRPQYALQLAPGPGFTGNVTISCGGAPTAATCSANPNLLTVTNANSIPFQLTITTKGSSSLPPAEIRFRPNGWTLRNAAFVGVLVLLVCFVNLGRRYRMQAAFGFCQCCHDCWSFVAAIGRLRGGSATAAQPAPTPPTPSGISTPAGTTSITVTATSGTLTPQTIQLTLIVH